MKFMEEEELRLYPLEKTGKISNYANTTHFKNVKSFDPFKGGARFNKAEREVMKKIGWHLDKKDLEVGSLWLDKKDILSIVKSLENITDITYNEAEIVGELLLIFDICLEKGYGVRVY